MNDQVFYARSFALVALAVLGYLLYRILEPFFAPIAWALFIAFLLQPAHQRLSRRLGRRPNLSAALLSAATLIVILGPLAALGTAFAAQAAELVRWVQAFAAEHRPASAADLEAVPVLGPALVWVQETTGVSLGQIRTWAIEGARAVLNMTANLGRIALLGALGTVVGFVLMMFILFFAIRDGREFLGTLRKLVPLPREDRARLFAHLAAVTRATVFGTGVTAIAQGVLVGIGFALVGLPSPMVFGVLAALAALVPLAGTPVVWVPAVIVLAAQGRWYAAIFLAVWGALVATLDNFVRPMLVSGRAQIGTLTVFLGVLGGAGAFGAIGVILGPLVLALIVALVEFALETGSAEPPA